MCLMTSGHRHHKRKPVRVMVIIMTSMIIVFVFIIAAMIVFTVIILKVVVPATFPPFAFLRAT